MTAREWLDTVEARANAATDGPWQPLIRNSWAGSAVVGTEGGHPLAVLDSSDHPDDDAIADAEFIAHARADVPALVAALRAVLEVCDIADRAPADAAPGLLSTRGVRAAIDAHVPGGAS